MRAAGQPHAIGDFRHRANGRVRALVLRHEQHAVGVADVDRQGHVHVREDDGVLQRNQHDLVNPIISS